MGFEQWRARFLDEVLTGRPDYIEHQLAHAVRATRTDVPITVPRIR